MELPEACSTMGALGVLSSAFSLNASTHQGACKCWQCIQNDIVVNFNDVIKIGHWARNIESGATCHHSNIRIDIITSKKINLQCSLFCGYKDLMLEGF